MLEQLRDLVVDEAGPEDPYKITLGDAFEALYDHAFTIYEQTVQALVKHGVARQEAHSLARSVIPQADKISRDMET